MNANTHAHTHSDGDDMTMCAGYLEDVTSNKLKRGEMLADITTLLGAGLHTTSRNTEKCLLYCAKYPSVQRRVFEELKAVFPIPNIRGGNGNGSTQSKKIKEHFSELLAAMLGTHAVLKSVL